MSAVRGGAEGQSAGDGEDGVADAVRAAVEDANRSFYEAMENADLDAMTALWADGADAEHVTCVHPGWPMLRGRSSVLRSIAMIMANTSYAQFFLTEVQVTVAGDAAVVACAEHVLTGFSGTQAPPTAASFAGGFEGGTMQTTNVLVLVDGTWRMLAHHASPVLGQVESDDGDASGHTEESS